MNIPIIFGTSEEDASVTRNALAGRPFFERNEISQFLKVSNPLPLIDLGANLGLITLQAAKQGRRVVAVEPAPQNALRLCRSVVDFGHAPLVLVVQNAVSSEERNVSLVLPGGMSRTWYRVSDHGAEGKAEENGNKRTKSSDSSQIVFAIGLDRLLDVVPFTKAAMKVSLTVCLSLCHLVLAVSGGVVTSLDFCCSLIQSPCLLTSKDYGPF